ncbi:MAG: hypothetical protein AAF615_07855 [Pseudomonadota bacterium]
MNGTGSENVTLALVSLCNEISTGRYENIDQLYALTGQDNPDPHLAELAEAFGMMVVKLEVREMKLNETIERLRDTQSELERARADIAAENRQLRRKIGSPPVVIDEAQRQRAVSEVLENPTFSAIAASAQKLRKRRRDVD